MPTITVVEGGQVAVNVNALLWETQDWGIYTQNNYFNGEFQDFWVYDMFVIADIEIWQGGEYAFERTHPVYGSLRRSVLIIVVAAEPELAKNSIPDKVYEYKVLFEKGTAIRPKEVVLS